METNERISLKVHEAAEMVGLSRAMGYLLVTSGEWPHFKVGRAVRIPVAALPEWVETNTRYEPKAG